MLDQGAELAFMNVAADQGEGAETAEDQLQELLGESATVMAQHSVHDSIPAHAPNPDLVPLPQPTPGAFFSAEVQTANDTGKASGGLSVGSGSRAPTRADDETPLSDMRSAGASIATGQTSPYGDESASLASGAMDEPLDLDEHTAKLSAFMPSGLTSPK